ncbi:MAG: hypothetical protein IPM13_18235 [Phycisphaerales bacterium]|nr:hypothetical protein [Phycisphaerales bacterium]
MSKSNLLGTPFRTIVALLALEVSLAPCSRSPRSRRSRAVRWSTDFDQALATAKAGQKLTLVCFNMDGEEANESALLMYRSDEFRKATENVVCVLCSADAHGAPDAPCSRFAGCTCAEHVASEKQARRHFYGASRENLAPQHLLLYPDGTVAWHAVYEVAPGAIYKAIAAAEKSKAQTMEQRLRGQRALLSQLSRRTGKGSPTEYMQIHAMLVQTPPANFCDALQAVSKPVAELVIRDLPGHRRDHALAMLEAATKHSAKPLRDIATRLADEVRARPPEVPPVVTPPPPPAQPAGVQPLTEPLVVIGPADDFDRVHWTGDKRTLADCRDRIAVIWFFMIDAPDLQSSVATMNEFAAANRSRGIETIGLAGATQTADALEKLPRSAASSPSAPTPPPPGTGRAASSASRAGSCSTRMRTSCSARRRMGPRTSGAAVGFSAGGSVDGLPVRRWSSGSPGSGSRTA